LNEAVAEAGSSKDAHAAPLRRLPTGMSTRNNSIDEIIGELINIKFELNLQGTSG
jgi:hypothetical protein